MDMLMIFIFANQILYIFGKVIVLRGLISNTYGSKKVKLICLSKDDGSALVWNYNLIWKYKYYSVHGNNYEFHDLNKFNNSEINCKMNANEDCLESWIKHEWNITNSIKTPMGPVFDQRWEEFKQYENLQNTDYYFKDELIKREIKLAFSVRTSHSMHMLICNGEDYNKDSCYWILIGGWNNTLSVIRKCVMGIPELGKEPPEHSECRNAQSSFKHTPLSESEWRTFIITWNAEMRKIIIYDTDKIILTYTDEKGHSSNNYYLFIRSDTAMLIRLHLYYFLHTTVENAVLTSPIFQLNNEMICVQLLIGLCAECDAHVTLLDSTNNEELVKVIVKGSTKSAVHGLPMWQSVEIKKNSSIIDSNTYSKIIIKLIPKLNNHSSNPLWAIANVRQCPQNEALRKGVIFSSYDWDVEFGYFWPEVTCQKLSYDKHVVVNTISPVDLNINLEDANCPQGRIGPQCLVSCESDLGSDVNCKETEICYENGCTCAPGFIGDTCSTPCDSTKYGHGCKKTCGTCFYIRANEECNKATGMCIDEMCYKGDSTKIYIPPLCQISINKPNAPTVSTSETSIWAVVPITWKDEYEEKSILYSFVIQEHIKYKQPSWKKLFRNMTHLTEHFENVEPGATYHIGLSLDISGTQVQSEWRVAETKCNPENFDVIPEENGMVIEWQIHQLYSCPPSWYNLIIRKVNTNEEVVSISAPSFPYKVQELPSYTFFDVIIFHKDNMLFHQKIRTLEDIPSTKMSQVTLIWNPSNQPNGEIVRYEVILEINKYYGCTDLKLSTLDKHIITKFTTETTITISDLHPYASYSAKVIAHNSQHFSLFAEAIFKTAESEIPSEVFSQLRLEGWKLLWSPPADCTTILGPLKARIKIQGISNAVKYYNVTKMTAFTYFNLDYLYPKLNGLERYLVKLYVIRNYKSKENTTAYQKFEFKTPPTAPPKVTNLEIVEIDTRQMIYLRWQSPRPPLNGILRDYNIELCNKYNILCSNIKVQLNESCDLWNDYICKVVQNTNSPTNLLSQTIKVFAYNMNVTEPGLPASVTEDMLLNTTPDAPDNYTFTVSNDSIIDLNWLHPWKTGGHLKSFRIRIQEISSNLKKSFSRSLRNEVLEFSVTQYMRNYSERLYLFPSTQYIIYLQAVTVANKSSNTKFVNICTPSTTVFDGVLDVMVDNSNSTVLLNIPSVLNDTQDSMMHIIVKGPNSCKQYSEVPKDLRERAGVKMYENAWQAAEVSTSELAGGQFKIGDNRIYGNAINCPLKSKGLYEIVIIVIEQNSICNSKFKPIMLTKLIHVDDASILSMHYVAWMVPIILLFVVLGTAFYLYRRKKQKRIKQLIQNEIALPENKSACVIESLISNSKEDLPNLSDK
ncbi:uncharacterized protein LOC105835724 isoform X4 [Monomorium pharaonis]|uniref:uncharacterized protein LOC105835724 isoform X4 n=1 Tax=Monomorium pharaonis TaxID=307658 RepID=UPI001745F843|nr:uncharacterized protein LOC105835724 isoform X4 [Monomorium pharaonis]